jgi:hypothetical protein
MLRTVTNISVQPSIIKPGMSSTPTDLHDLRRLIALKTSKSEIGAKYINSKDDKRVGKTYFQNCLRCDFKFI